MAETTTGAQQTLAVAMTGDSQLVAGGLTTSNVTFSGTGGTPITLTGTGGVDGYVVKYSASGVPQWAKLLASQGGSELVVTEAVAGDAAGNVYAAGRFTGMATIGAVGLTSSGGQDVFVAKWNTTGTLQWAQRYGDTDDDQALAVAADSGGNVLLTGSYETRIDFGGGTITAGKITSGLPTVFLAKLSPTGTHVWSKGLTGTASEFGYGLAISAADAVAVGGTFSDRITPGTTQFISAGSTDVWLAQYTSAGAHSWSFRGGGTNIDGLRDVAASAGGRVVAVGEFRGDAAFGGGTLSANSSVSDSWFGSYTSTGAHEWSTSGGVPLGEDGAYGVGIDAAGTTFATGKFLGGSATFGAFTLPIAGVWDIYVVELDATGAFTGAEQWGGTSQDEGRALDAWGAGDVVVGGMFQGTCDFDAMGTKVSGGSFDGFTARINR